MHTYVIEKDNNNFRKNIYIGLFIFTFVLTNLLHIILANIDLSIIPNNINFLISIPSFFGVYGIVYKLFDNYLWETKKLNKLLATPNLSGNWKGFIKTSHNGENMDKPIKVEMEISQTWSAIKIKTKTSSSCSESKLCGMILDKSSKKLKFEYYNDPKYDSDEKLNIHIGYNVFDIKNIDGKMVLNGKYFSGRNRKNYGVIKVVKNKANMSFEEANDFLENKL